MVSCQETLAMLSVASMANRPCLTGLWPLVDVNFWFGDICGYEGTLQLPGGTGKKKGLTKFGHFARGLCAYQRPSRTNSGFPLLLHSGRQIQFVLATNRSRRAAERFTC